MKTVAYKPGPDCHHVEQPALSHEEYSRRVDELQQRHWCPDCDRMIFSQFWLEWSLKHNTFEDICPECRGRGQKLDGPGGRPVGCWHCKGSGRSVSCRSRAK